MKGRRCSLNERKKQKIRPVSRSISTESDNSTGSFLVTSTSAAVEYKSEPETLKAEIFIETISSRQPNEDSDIANKTEKRRRRKPSLPLRFSTSLSQTETSKEPSLCKEFATKKNGGPSRYRRCRLCFPSLKPQVSPPMIGILTASSLISFYSWDNNVGHLTCRRDQTAGSYPEDFSKHDLESISYVQILKTQFEDEAVIKMGAMQRANSTVEDFCRSYFMFHGMDANKAHSIFIFLPVLYFTESYIYQLDTLNEKQLLRSADDSSENSCHKSFIYNPFDALVHLLQQQGLMTERIGNELNLGVEYWKLERKLCDGLTKKTMIQIEDVLRAIHLKSFDYRVLNLLLYQLRGQPVNDLHMEFLSVSEFLVEVSDDLYDYEEDVIDNTFNILRMFVGIYGPSKAPVLLAKCITKAEENYARLSRDIDPELSFNYWRRYEEATSEGCSNLGHAVGRWTIPSIIVDEESFRLQVFANNVKN